jgi:hypothetical protein
MQAHLSLPVCSRMIQKAAMQSIINEVFDEEVAV